MNEKETIMEKKKSKKEIRKLSKAELDFADAITKELITALFFNEINKSKLSKKTNKLVKEVWVKELNKRKLIE